jgi:hypothetical protein
MLKWLEQTMETMCYIYIQESGKMTAVCSAMENMFYMSICESGKMTAV